MSSSGSPNTVPVTSSSTTTTTTEKGSSPALKVSSVSDETQKVEWHYYVVNWTKYFVAGGVAGASAKSFVAPLERVKILLQVDGIRPAGQERMTSYGIRSTLANIYQKQGFLSLWSGNGVSMMRIVPYAAVQFSAHEFFKSAMMEQGETNLPPAKRLLAGSLAGVVSVIATYPLDVLRTRFAANSSKGGRQSLRESVKLMIKNEGYGAFVKGIWPTLMGIIPYAGINYFTFESLKMIAPKKPDSDTLTFTASLVCGSLSGLVGQTVTYPLDVVRRRMQLEGMFHKQPLYANTFNAIITILRTEGVRGMFRGLTLNYLRVAPAVTISFTVYEHMKHILKPDPNVHVKFASG